MYFPVKNPVYFFLYPTTLSKDAFTELQLFLLNVFIDDFFFINTTFQLVQV